VLRDREKLSYLKGNFYNDFNICLLFTVQQSVMKLLCSFWIMLRLASGIANHPYIRCKKSVEE